MNLCGGQGEKEGSRACVEGMACRSEVEALWGAEKEDINEHFGEGRYLTFFKAENASVISECGDTRFLCSDTMFTYGRSYYVD